MNLERTKKLDNDTIDSDDLQKSSSYTMNAVGSPTINLPSTIDTDTLYTFNITNTDIDTKYTGTMLTYTFPFDCRVKIEAYGARGGKGNKATLSNVGYGAKAQGTFNFLEGDTLLMCVGQAGTDFVGSYSDGTTGAGGGGTFIVKKTTDGSGDTYSGSGVGNGWKVKPLLVASGGNGSRDIGYSGTGTIYEGEGFGGSAPTYNTYSGGGYNRMYSSSNGTCGKSFLAGASGATSAYNRNSTSIAGFGCGGGNKDDGDGGGGGGYYGGTLTSSAYSYIDSSATSPASSMGHNSGEGKIVFQFLEINDTKHTMNAVGSSTINLPSKFEVGYSYVFNITNTNVDTKYTGTMLTYTFPFNCKVSITALGARGGMGNKATLSQTGYGAMVSGVCNFKKGDTLLMCVGQAGTDFVGSVSDGTTGAGGGGSFVTLKMNDGTGDLYNGSGVGNGWRVKPLLIASGGNGSRDIGYSGSGTVYHGQGTGGSAPSYSSYSGGGYNGFSNNDNAGKSFLNGASGASSSYTRTSTSIAGFGCGGGNIDDGEGGGGGGYYGGLRTRSAYSYIDSSVTNRSSQAGYNSGEGKIIFTFLEIVSGAKVNLKVNGVWKESTEIKVNVNGTWRNVAQIFTNVNGTWKESV